jgi:protein toll
VTFGILDVFDQRPNPEFIFCFHERNWKAGSAISDNIFRSVEESRKTLIILSKTFVKNKWFHLEFRAALMQMLKDRRDRIIFIIKGDMPDSNELPRDVRYILATRTYLVWREKWFIEKLRYSLHQDSVSLREMLRDFCAKVGNCFRSRRTYSRGELI